ncbi:NAD-dependent epimerase/dehydratase family protein [Galbibacter mesophilus]|uniref:NAD-dependent epimerase/dehydratase family protein n=1 Tax=Galbibacter mesophilus TaxID=379069 RepID=UPI00191FF4F4|nr:NAD-dependent epimerase/dehydratase family protein [Galbibacter mesophilus]MCM5662147.1 NAD-dependent epimerase/dehydratase family protein [Galbibacter mesophilus]
MILVTGGTGLIGAHLLLHLAKEERAMKATYRTQDKIALVKDFFSSEGYSHYFQNIEWQEADVTNIPALEKVFEGVTHVYHCAGLISFDPSDYKILRQTNIEGTANIVNLCITHKIKKLCHLSSIATLGTKPTNEDIDETVYWNPEAENNVYAITKYGAEMEVWRGTQEGVDAVILNPGVVFGEGFNDAPSNAFFSKIKNGLSFYPTGGTAFVDVKDVVKAMVNAMNLPVTNERFIIVGENKTYQSVLEGIADALNTKKPTKKLPAWQLSILWRLDWFLALFPGRKRKLTKTAANSLTSQTFYSHNKAKDTLGITFTKIEDTIKRIVAKNS